MMLALHSGQQMNALGSGRDDRMKKPTDPFAMITTGGCELQARFLIL